MPEASGEPSRPDMNVITRRVALSTDIGLLATLYLHVACDCRSVVCPISLMLRRGHRGRLEDVLARLRCEGKCKQRPWEVTLAEDTYGKNARGMQGHKPGWHLVLMGPNLRTER